MAPVQRRKAIFAGSLLVLALGAFGIAVLGPSDHWASRVSSGSDVAAGRVGAGRSADGDHMAPSQLRLAALAARRFIGAYLSYESGSLGPKRREALAESSTRDLGGQLLDAPVRIPVGHPAPKQIVARIAAVQAGLFDGHASLLVTAVVGGPGGSHLLRASLVEDRGEWLVAGIGP